MVGSVGKGGDGSGLQDSLAKLLCMSAAAGSGDKATRNHSVSNLLLH